MPHPNHQFNMSDISEWRALKIQQVDAKALLLGTVKEDDLPVSYIPSWTDKSDIAVLTWRWDGKFRALGSLNVFCAIIRAKTLGIGYLLIDALSIDQDLGEEELLQKVIEFSKFYTTVQVIAAYDMPGEDIRESMLRPWIFSEARLSHSNPFPIQYVGHAGTGLWPAKHKPEYVNVSNTPFSETLLYVSWTSGFTPTILGLLFGYIGMHSIGDLALVIPCLSTVLRRAYRRMSREDYLLSAALLCQCHYQDREGKTDRDCDYSRPRLEIEELNFDRYTFKLEKEHVQSDYGVKEFGIFLDGKKLATWEYQNVWGYGNTFMLDPQDDAERILFEALGFSQSAYDEYASPDVRQPRLSALVGKEKSALSVPGLELTVIDLETEEQSTVYSELDHGDRGYFPNPSKACIYL